MANRRPPPRRNWWALIVLGAIAAVGGTVWAHPYRQQQAWDRVRQQASRYGLPQLDSLHHRDFEYAIRHLVLRDGCTDARQVGGAGDNGADIVLAVTNGRFTTHCAPLAAQLNMHLADRRTLATWASGGRPLWELLPKIPTSQTR
ncbi:restriction endonuclease [Streptomyces microflavus]|uniref:restriction endonuclease n=1 Tax=Streptomyces microflavus TaxID=1919 RepID=UPI0033AE8C35